MKICMLVNNPISNDPRVKWEAAYLAAAGYDVTIFGLLLDGFPETETWGKVKFIRLPDPFPKLDKVFQLFFSLLSKFGIEQRRFLYDNIRLKRTRQTIINAILRSDYDVFHAHDIDRLEIASICAKMTRTQLVYDSHELFLEDYFLNNREILSKTAVESLLSIQAEHIRQAGLVITVCDNIASTLREVYTLTNDPTVIYNCAAPRKRGKTNFLREEFLRTAPERKIILYQGGIQKGRGLEFFIELSSSVPNADFVIIGPQIKKRYGRHIEALAAGKSNLFLLPPVPYSELWKITASADIGACFIEPISKSYEYAIPNKLFEYLEVGLPVLVSNTAGFLEVNSKLEGNTSPLITLPKDSKIASRIVNQIIKTDLTALSEAAYLAVSSTFSRDIEGEKLLEAYDSLHSI